MLASTGSANVLLLSDTGSCDEAVEFDCQCTSYQPGCYPGDECDTYAANQCLIGKLLGVTRQG